MSVLKLDPPPETDDIRELRAYVNDLFTALSNVVYNIDEDNFSDEFLSKMGGGS